MRCQRRYGWPNKADVRNLWSIYDLYVRGAGLGIASTRLRGPPSDISVSTVSLTENNVVNSEVGGFGQLSCLLMMTAVVQRHVSGWRRLIEGTVVHLGCALHCPGYLNRLTKR